ncbi:hypothetical protein PsYK624_137820 [Phanerochaete sordida]|uniref:Heterokaryon incompatibility domain-containing protein n=1 Tax=Phanerochaete sordida TaxID=48140 RepID=A0A9P3GMN4_9APHY|nr:hypothetical protein PsYK624_137820 [Phanerochaete sordida]
MGVQGLLRQLNDVLGANLMLGHPGLRQCLEYFVKSSMDFGEAYGYLRTMDRTDFERVLQRLADQQQTDEGLRKKAVQGSYIDNADVEPRRVWDVLSNRVLPFYVIPKNSKRRFPQNVWTISHSWVPPEVRQLVWTPVNGNRWPVPIPQATTLDHARVELLNFGVEYSWLDVLCLRQRGRPEDEAMRTEEWKLDVPTIGRVYQLDWPCVTYFNGLGLPFDPSPQTLSSAQHWLRRVWTLQETTSSWLPGGATGDASDAARAFFHEHLPRDAPTLEYGRWDKAVAALQVRHCTTELDRVHALAYVFSCHTLPIYDEGMTPPLAWAVLLKHMSPGMRGSVAELYVQRFPERTALLPSWEELLQCPPGSDMVPLWNPWVDLVDPSCRSSSDPAVYSQKTKHVGILSMSQQGDDETYSPIFEPSDHLRSTLSDRLSPSRYQILGRYQPNTKYSVIDFSGGLCLVVEIVGKRTIGGQSWLEVVKRGCLQFAAPLAWEIFKNFDNISVVHATVDD